MKGIILAGGTGSRLYPATRVVSKQLLPVHDKPMIYYPLSVLMLAGIRDILIISSEKYLTDYRDLFGTGQELGINISYASQDKPRGIADAFLIASEYIGDDTVCLILGDNIFYGHGLSEIVEKTRIKVEDHNDAVIFGYFVDNPEDYGVILFDKDKNIVSIEEKPERPGSNCVATGLYFYGNDVVECARELKPSGRGELEITDLNRIYLRNNRLKVELLGRGFAWFDTGTPKSLRESGDFIATIEQRQSLKIGCIEEIAYRRGYIDSDQLIRLAKSTNTNGYGEYLLNIAGEDNAV